MVTLQYSYLLKVYEHEKPQLLLNMWMVEYLYKVTKFWGAPHCIVKNGLVIAECNDSIVQLQSSPAKYFPVPNNIQK